MTRMTGGGRFTDRDLPVAIASGVLMAGLFLATIRYPLAFSIFVGVLVLTGLVEAGRALNSHGVALAVPVVFVAAVVTLVGVYLAGAAGQVAGMTTLFVGAVVWELAHPDRGRAFVRVSHTVLLGLWLPFLGSYALLLVLRPDDGTLAILATAGAAIFSDIGGYAVGSAFGRHKLAPSVSPGKTWEGVVGGLAIAAVLAALVLPRIGDVFSWWFAVVFALLVGTSGVIGDLVESMLKRDLHVKDFGAIIPGHGGILDRVDGILIALPVGYYLLRLAT